MTSSTTSRPDQRGPKTAARTRIYGWIAVAILTCAASVASAQTPYLWYTLYDSVGATTTRSLRGLALSDDESTAYLGFIQGSSTSAIRLINADTGSVSSTTNVGSTTFEALDTDDRGYVYAARSSSSTSLAVFDSATTALVGSASSGATGNRGVAVFKDGSTYYAYLATASAVRRFDVTTPTAPTLDTTWASSGVLSAFGSAVLRGVHVDASGVLYVVARDSNQVFRVSSGTSPSVTHTSTAVTRPVDATIDGTSLFVTSYNAASSLVAELNPADLSLIRTLSTGLSRGALEGYSGIDVTAAGEFYVADQIYGGTSTVTSDRVLLGSPNAKTFDIASGTTTISQIMAGSGGIVKSGAGTLLISAANLFTGTTTVSGGTLTINGVQTSATGAVSVAAGATLSGTGTVGGSTTVAGSHAPGATVGVQTFTNGLSYDSDSTLVWELSANTDALGSRGSSYDGVNLSGGTLALQSGVDSSLVFDGAGSTVDWSDSFWGANHSWTVFDATAAGSGSFDPAGISVGLDSVGAALAAIRPGAIFAWSTDGTDIFLTYTAPPPPTETPTETPVPPTDTPLPPSATPTDTPIPPTPTETDTPAPATDTPTESPVPPTDTPVPPSATPTDTPIPPTPTQTDTPAATATDTPVPSSTPTATATTESGGPFVQSKAQQKCLNELAGAVARLAAIQGREGLACLADAGSGVIADAQACLSADADDKIATAQSRALELEIRKCVEQPDFGFAGAAVLGVVAVDERRALTADLFGSDFGLAVILRSSDAAGADCQRATAMAADKLASGFLKEFRRCQKAGLADATIAAGSDLAVCMSLIANGSTRLQAKLREQVVHTLAQHCAGVPLASAFPGTCAGAGSFATCVAERVNCRGCRTCNAAEALALDCDALDDGLSNSSCPN